MTPLGAVLRGVIAGAVGTVAMDTVWFARHRRDGGRGGFVEWQFGSGSETWEDAPVPAQVGKRLAEGFLQRELKPERARLVTSIVHWATGVLWGAAYGVAAGSSGRRSIRGGVPFGLLVWTSGYVILAPSGLYKPMWEYDAVTLWKDASAHVAYGLGTAAAFRALAGR